MELQAVDWTPELVDRLVAAGWPRPHNKAKLQREYLLNKELQAAVYQGLEDFAAGHFTVV